MSDPTQDAPTAPTIAPLLARIDVEQLDRDLFRGDTTATPGSGPRLFGGQVAAQALRAATRTIDNDHTVHSMHGYFLRPGRPDTPLILQVDRIRGGTSFTTRRVVAIQNGEAIFNLATSFHKVEDGAEYRSTMPAGVPDPEDDDYDWAKTPFSQFLDRMPFEIKELPVVGPDVDGAYESTRRVWVRSRGSIGDDVAMHACVTTYFSDMGAVYASARSVGAELGTVQGASLDHAIWFHRPLDLSEWTLYDLTPVSAGGARGLSRGAMYRRDGVLAVSVAQEALIRPMR